MKDELQTIKAHHDSLPGPAPQVAARAWDLLTAEAEAERAGSSPRRPVGWRLRRWPGPGRIALRAGVAVGLAAAVTAGVVMVRVDDGPALLGVQPANAAELLQHAAAVAAEGDPQPRPDQFLYVDRKDVTHSFGFGPSTGSYEYTQDVRREVWIPAADPGKALARSTYGDKHGSALPPEMDIQPAGTVEYQRAGQCHQDVLRAPSRGAGDLPSDPDRLLAEIRKDAEALVRADRPGRGEAPPSADQVDRRIERVVAMKLLLLVEDPFAASRDRAVVFRALSKMPTATMLPDLTDPAGRHGVGASIRYQGPDGWEHKELIFEPKTYRFLGWQSWTETEQKDGQAKEAMRGGTAVMTVKVVDSMPEVPKDAAKPAFC
ncbi:CU044_5270 family protein [Streptosporangium roseum]|uniref:CU044_5270 family protein n=1 Tax=Streptosporangium roseum TaxID=2001 RepID=UPI0004CD1A9A|nr:CU044_5270 family protein [Streptosporangium roseum]